MALRDGSYEHERRYAVEEKNLLAMGAIEAEDVVILLQRCRGSEYRVTRHHWDREIEVHGFTPVVDEIRWYMKAYFLGDTAWFISIHRSEPHT